MATGKSMQALLFDETLTTATIALAAEDVTTQEQAAALFLNWRRHAQAPVKSVGGDTLMPAGTFDPTWWMVAQGQVSRLLPQIKAFDTLTRSGRDVLYAAISEGLVLDGQVTLQASRDGLGLRLQNATILGAISFGLLPFVVPEGWPASRLGQCRHCGRYFLRRDGSPGRIQVFCKPPRTCADVAHVRAHRARHK